MTVPATTNTLTKADTIALWHALDAMKYQIVGMRELNKEMPGKFTPDQIGAEVERLTQARRALRKVNEIRKKSESAWHPQFDLMSAKQEELVMQFCAEIAGPRGEKGSPPDPVRLLEMAEALYEAERGDALVGIGGSNVAASLPPDPASRVDSTQTHNSPPSDCCVRASARARGIVWQA